MVNWGVHLYRRCTPNPQVRLSNVNGRGKFVLGLCPGCFEKGIASELFLEEFIMIMKIILN